MKNENDATGPRGNGRGAAHAARGGESARRPRAPRERAARSSRPLPAAVAPRRPAGRKCPGDFPILLIQITEIVSDCDCDTNILWNTFLSKFLEDFFIY